MSISIVEALRLSIAATTGRKVFRIHEALALDGRISQPSGALYLSIEKVGLLGHHPHDGYEVSYYVSMFQNDEEFGIMIPSLFSIGLSGVEREATATTYTVGDQVIHGLFSVFGTSNIYLEEPDLAAKEIKKIELHLSDGAVFAFDSNGNMVQQPQKEE